MRLCFLPLARQNKSACPNFIPVLMMPIPPALTVNPNNALNKLERRKLQKKDLEIQHFFV